MKNITTDLEERLEEVADERSRLQRQLDALADRETTLKSLLETEANRWGQQHRLPEEFQGNGHGSLYGNFVLQALKQGERDLESLKRLALDMQLEFGNKSPGRAIHFALVGLQRRGLIDRTDDDNWILKNLE